MNPTDNTESKTFTIRLDHICNNNCSFCFVQNTTRQNYHPPIKDLIVQIEKFPDDFVIDVFGGEPTLYEKFFQLMDYLLETKRNVTLASNLTMFSDKKFARKFMKYDNVSMIRTTLLGKNHETHDHYTRTADSFDRTVKAFEIFSNFLERIDILCVNTVILPLNYDQLTEMFEMLYSFGVNKYKYGLPRGGFLSDEHILRVGKIRPRLLDVAYSIKGSGSDLKIEKSPICLAPEFLEDYLHGGRGFYYNECKLCIHNHHCDGFSELYTTTFKNDSLLPQRSKSDIKRE